MLVEICLSVNEYVKGAVRTGIERDDVFDVRLDRVGLVEGHVAGGAICAEYRFQIDADFICILRGNNRFRVAIARFWVAPRDARKSRPWRKSAWFSSPGFLTARPQ
jgi:hypothetical protein